MRRGLTALCLIASALALHLIACHWQRFGEDGDVRAIKAHDGTVLLLRSEIGGEPSSILETLTTVTAQDRPFWSHVEDYDGSTTAQRQDALVEVHDSISEWIDKHDQSSTPRESLKEATERVSEKIDSLSAKHGLNENVAGDQRVKRVTGFGVFARQGFDRETARWIGINIPIPMLVVAIVIALAWKRRS